MEVPATTVDRQCGSSQQAVHFAANLIQSGVCDITIAAGVESMSRVPMGSTVLQGPGTPFPPELLELYNLVNQGLAAEMIAAEYGITRQECDELATESHRRAAAAQSEGRFDREIAPYVVGENGDSHVVSQDQGIRPTTTPESLAALQPSFKPDGILHAGNSSQITDGASAILLMSRQKAEELGLSPRARVRAQAVVGVDPVTMLKGPIPATTKVLAKAGLAISDIDLFEVNEAFAPVPLAWAREHNPDMDRVNVNGGAIALGHPLGASGARLMTTLLHELERSGRQVGLETMCCGGGLGTATIIDREV
jgi:acetyl-CoA acyltransferase